MMSEWRSSVVSSGLSPAHLPHAPPLCLFALARPYLRICGVLLLCRVHLSSLEHALKLPYCM
eukprot:5986544-Pyramimonas_sp.AAC.1